MSQLNIGTIRPMSQADRVNIPGPALPRGVKAPAQAAEVPYYFTHVMLINVQQAGFLIGNVCCRTGDVLKIDEDPRDGRHQNILTDKRARELIRMGKAQPHAGPATFSLSNPTRAEAVASVQAEIERTDLAREVEAGSERAIGRPQRKGAI